MVVVSLFCKMMMKVVTDSRAVNWDPRVQGLAGPSWTRESESNFKGLARLAYRGLIIAYR